MFDAMFDEDKKLKTYIPVLFFLGAAIVAMFFFGKYSVLQSELIYPLLAEEYGNGFVIWYKQNMSNQSVLSSIFGGIGIFISPFIGAFLNSCLVVLVCNVFFKSEIKFKRFYVFSLYVGIISVVGGVLSMIMSVLASTGTNVFALSMAMDYNPTSFVYNLLSSISIFSILEWILIFMGIKYYAKLEGNKGKIAAAICIAVMLAVTAGFALMATGNPAEGFQFKIAFDAFEKL